MNKVLLATILLTILGNIEISAMQQRSVSAISGKVMIARSNSPTVVVPNGNTPRLQLIANEERRRRGQTSVYCKNNRIK